jgi:chemotaxis signal transduction protein
VRTFVDEIVAGLTELGGESVTVIDLERVMDLHESGRSSLVAA